MITLQQQLLLGEQKDEYSIDVLFESQNVPLNAFVCELCFDATKLKVLDIKYDTHAFHNSGCYMSQLIDNELGRIFIMCGFAGSCCLGREKFSFATMKVACVSATEAVFKLGDRTRAHVYG